MRQQAATARAQLLPPSPLELILRFRIVKSLTICHPVTFPTFYCFIKMYHNSCQMEMVYIRVTGKAYLLADEPL